MGLGFDELGILFTEFNWAKVQEFDSELEIVMLVMVLCGRYVCYSFCSMYVALAALVS